ncbi:MAG: 50S ribosomal protein L4 [Candidatus Fimenecus sp.]
MAKIDVLSKEGKKVSEIELNDAVFGIVPNESAVHEVVVAHLAARRQGTQSTKTRAEVRGGGKKPWRQKGTGRARQGSIRSPQWTHGGIALGPKPRLYVKHVNKKLKALAMRSVLSAKVADKQFDVLDSFGFNEIKTKEAVKILTALNVGKNTLVVLNETDDVAYRSFRNIEGVKVAPVSSLGVYDVVRADTVVVLKDAVAKIEEVYA